MVEAVEVLVAKLGSAEALGPEPAVQERLPDRRLALHLVEGRLREPAVVCLRSRSIDVQLRHLALVDTTSFAAMDDSDRRRFGLGGRHLKPHACPSLFLTLRLIASLLRAQARALYLGLRRAAVGSRAVSPPTDAHTRAG